MLKIVVVDSGYGGELFADKLEEELPVDVMRVILWRNVDELFKNTRHARKIVENALTPYIGNVDLIFLANHLLSIANLKYLSKKYRQQRFLGFKLPNPRNCDRRKTLILTTTPVSKTINYHNYLFRLKGPHKTLTLNTWPNLIDDGELTQEEITRELKQFSSSYYLPEIIILACGQFSDIKKELRKATTLTVKIVDSFEDSIRDICKALKIRGGVKKRK